MDIRLTLNCCSGHGGPTSCPIFNKATIQLIKDRMAESTCHEVKFQLDLCASQLYDKNSASIAKTLLMQMPQMSFTQFRNELARVLGTCQRSGGKTSAKTASISAVEVKAEEKSPQAKSKSKKDSKISAQSLQIKDLQTKLDQAVVENAQIKEFLIPTALQQAFTTALQSTKAGPSNNTSKGGPGKEFQGICRPPKLAAGLDGKTVPEQSWRYCKDTGHKLKNCPRLAAKNEFLAAQQQQQKGGLN